MTTIYRISRMPDTRTWKLQSFMLYVQVQDSDHEWQDFVHPRRGSAFYDSSQERLVHHDVQDVYPDAEQEER